MTPTHPHDLELVAWVDGELRGTPEHGQVARHIMACHECAGLLLRADDGDATYELLRTAWRDLATRPADGGS